MCNYLHNISKILKISESYGICIKHHYLINSNSLINCSFNTSGNAALLTMALRDAALVTHLGDPHSHRFQPLTDRG